MASKNVIGDDRMVWGEDGVLLPPYLFPGSPLLNTPKGGIDTDWIITLILSCSEIPNTLASLQGVHRNATTFCSCQFSTRYTYIYTKSSASAINIYTYMVHRLYGFFLLQLDPWRFYPLEDLLVFFLFS